MFGPAGAMASTLEDLQTWAEALATGEGILSETSQAERVDGATPPDEGPDYDVYGIGIGAVAGFRGHTGGGFGITVLAMHDPDTGIGSVILINALGAPRARPHPAAPPVRHDPGRVGPGGVGSEQPHAGERASTSPCTTASQPSSAAAQARQPSARASSSSRSLSP